MKTQRGKNQASSADVMETEEISARLGQDAEKIFAVTGPLVQICTQLHDYRRCDIADQNVPETSATTVNQLYFAVILISQPA